MTRPNSVNSRLKDSKTHSMAEVRLMEVPAMLVWINRSGSSSAITARWASTAAPSRLGRVNKAIQRLRAISPAEGFEYLDADTVMSPGTLEAALRGVGAATAAVDAVFRGEADNAFCALRPPGHHAESRRAMGFCFFNNVALGARHAQHRHGADKVAIVDWDVHHGNGTQDLFYDDGSVLFFSTHQSPWYPFTGVAAETGEGRGRGTTLNCPLAAGAGLAEIGAAFEQRLLPALEAFKPDLILISAGFDSRENDPLGRFRLTDADFVCLTRQLKQAADRLCEGRLVSVLEGGYHLEGLARAVTAHVGELAAAD